jgi:hypothetical protein
MDLRQDRHIDEGGGTCHGIAQEFTRLWFDKRDSNVAGNADVIQAKLERKVTADTLGVRLRELEQQSSPENRNLSNQPFSESALTAHLQKSLTPSSTDKSLVSVHLRDEQSGHVLLVGYDKQKKQYFIKDPIFKGITSAPEYHQSLPEVSTSLFRRYTQQCQSITAEQFTVTVAERVQKKTWRGLFSAEASLKKTRPYNLSVQEVPPSPQSQIPKNPQTPPNAANDLSNPCHSSSL